MKKLSFTNLILTFLFALIRFIFKGYIGWIGLILVLLKLFGIINWTWWIILLPLEYGTIYCLYMTIDGVQYQLGLKSAGAYARQTSGLSKEESQNLQIHIIIKGGPEHIGETIDRLCKKQGRLKFNQALLDASLEHYYCLQLAMFADKNVNAYVTIKKWKEAGLKLPEEGSPEFG